MLPLHSSQRLLHTKRGKFAFFQPGVRNSEIVKSAAVRRLSPRRAGEPDTNYPTALGGEPSHCGGGLGDQGHLRGVVKNNLVVHRAPTSSSPRMATTLGGDADQGANTPIDVDKDERGPAGTESPAKKGRTQEQALTLSMLRTVLAEERERDREHLAQSLAGVKNDVAHMQSRVQEVETVVSQQVQDTVRALDRVTKSYDKQAEALEAVKAAQFHLEARVQSLEQKPPSTAPGSTADTEGGRKPALIIGGWHPDQAADETLKAAKEVLRSLEVPLNGEEMFVPGLRRGYAILPITAKPFEDEDARRLRVQGAIQRVRNANITLGQNESGGMRKLWIAISQSPERRRRAKLAGKIKRTILELGGNPRDLEVEFATGTVWHKHQKIFSATAEKPAAGRTQEWDGQTSASSPRPWANHSKMWRRSGGPAKRSSNDWTAS